jgi:hypothetical protein
MLSLMCDPSCNVLTTSTNLFDYYMDDPSILFPRLYDLEQLLNFIGAEQG